MPKIEKKIRGIIFFSFLLSVSFTYSQNNVLHVKSPNGKIDMALESGAKILWSVKHEDIEVIAPSPSLWFCNIKNIAGDNVVGYAETDMITE